MSEKCKSTSPSAMQLKNQCKTSNIEEKIDVISQLEKGEQTFGICHYVRYGHISVHVIHGNANRNTEGAKELMCLCSKTTTVLSELTVPKTMDVSYIFILVEINK